MIYWKTSKFVLIHYYIYAVLLSKNMDVFTAYLNALADIDNIYFGDAFYSMANSTFFALDNCEIIEDTIVFCQTYGSLLRLY